MDCSLPCTSVHGGLQARILEWLAISFSRGSIFPTQALNLCLLLWQVDSLPWDAILEKEMATHSSILAWRIPWTEELGGLSVAKSQTWLKRLAHYMQLCFNKLIIIKKLSVGDRVRWSKKTIHFHFCLRQKFSTFQYFVYGFCPL